MSFKSPHIKNFLRPQTTSQHSFNKKETRCWCRITTRILLMPYAETKQCLLLLATSLVIQPKTPLFIYAVTLDWKLIFVVNSVTALHNTARLRRHDLFTVFLSNYLCLPLNGMNLPSNTDLTITPTLT